MGGDFILYRYLMDSRRTWSSWNPQSAIRNPQSNGLLHRNQFLNRLPSPRLEGFFTAGFVSSWESVRVVESGSMNSCPRGKMAGSSIASLSPEGARGVEKAKSSASSEPSTFLAIS